MRRRFNIEEEKRVLELYNEGRSLTEISRIYNTSHKTIAGAVRRNNGLIRKRGKQYKFFTKEQEEEIVNRYNNGEARWRIANIFNVNYKLIDRILRKYNLKVENRISSGEKASNWKGGISYNHDGYRLRKLGEEHWLFPFANKRGYMLEHRLVMAEHLGRPLLKNETVHHIDGDKMNNNIENLQLRQLYHGKGVKLVCADCGSQNIRHEKI